MERAEGQATTLLLSHLSPEQATQYQQYRSFDVVGSLGGNYRVRYGRADNISRMADEASICCGPQSQGESLPIPDVMLAQYLALITDEAAFLRVAVIRAPWAEYMSCSCGLCQSGHWRTYRDVAPAYYLR